VLGLIIVLVLLGRSSGPDWLAGTFHLPDGGKTVINVGGRKIRTKFSDGETYDSNILSISYPTPEVAEMEVTADGGTARLRFTRAGAGLRAERLTAAGTWRDEGLLRR
jgi:hypothetical protein